MSGKIDDGGAAFPQLKNTGLARLDPDGGAQIDKECTGGMCLRDYFAGQALAATITATSAGQHNALSNKPEGTSVYDAVAMDAYVLADAMVAARKDNRHA